MRRLAVAALMLAAAPAAALGAGDGLADNPAFCFGFLEAQPGADAGALGRREADVRSLFAKIGPRDSTDERGFEDWARMGRAMASEGDAARRGALKEGCTRLLGGGR